MNDSSSETGISMDLPPLLHNDLIREYKKLTQQAINIFVGHPQFQDMMNLDLRVPSSQRHMDSEQPAEGQLSSGMIRIPSKTGEYTIARLSDNKQIEITINRNADIEGHPNIALESVRFMIKNQDPHLIKSSILSDTQSDTPDVLLEYHRTLKKGGGRTVRNNGLAVRKIKNFLDELGKNITSDNSS